MMHDGNWDARQWERIEEEYGEPAREVVRVMHWEMKVPLCHVAKALYVCESTLRKWCRIWGLGTRRQGYIKTGVPGKVQLRARLLGYDSVGQAIGAMRVEGLRWEDIQAQLKCASSTISRYMPHGVKGYYNLSEKGREVKVETRRRLNAEGRRGKMPHLRYVVPL